MTDSAWDEIAEVISDSPYPVTVLPPDPDRAARCLATLEITTRSWLGAVVANSGGLLVDHGWLRVFGSGTADLPDALVDTAPAVGGLIIAVDVLGGQFAWVPAGPGRPPTVHYFAPDELDWEDLEDGYADWLHSMLAGSMTEFYGSLRWPGWEAEVAQLSAAQGIHTVPPLFTVEGQDLSTVSRRAVPLTELVPYHHDLARQLAGHDSRFTARFSPSP